jgi:hypothetical protein
LRRRIGRIPYLPPFGPKVDSVTILRELLRRRLPVALIVAFAILVGFLISFRPSFPPQSRSYEVGIATARILVDTPSSQVVEVDAKGSETLGVRATLLANLMIEGEAKESIAKQAGLAPKKLLAFSEAAIEPRLLSAKKLSDPKLELMTTRVIANPRGDQLPIIEIEAQAPTVAGAAKLASGAVKGLEDYLDGKASAEHATDAKRLKVTGLGAPQVRLATKGPPRVIGLVAALFIVVIGCAAILAVSVLARRWREATASERGEADDLTSELSPLTLALKPSVKDGERDAGATRA